MESKTRNFKLYIVAGLLIIFMAFSSLLNKKLGIKDDNIVEEVVEEVVEAQTGMEVDLTPDSQEK